MKNRHGSALMIAFGVSVVVMGFTIILFRGTIDHTTNVYLDRNTGMTQSAAEAALDIAVKRIQTRLENATDENDINPAILSGFLTTLNWGEVNDTNGNGLPDFDEVDPSATVEYGRTRIMTYAVRDNSDPNYVRIYGMAQFNHTTSVYESCLKITIETKTNNAPQYWDPHAGIISDGYTFFTGNADIIGTEGNAVINDDVKIRGAFTLSGDLGVFGNLDTAGRPSIGSQTINTTKAPVPEVNISDLVSRIENDSSRSIDYILGADGIVYDGDQNELTDSGSYNGWSFTGDEWVLSGTSTEDGTYYIETDAKISGNTSKTETVTKTVWVPGRGRNPGYWEEQTSTVNVGNTVTYIVAGSIHVSGSGSFAAPATWPYFIVAGGDIKISGHSTWGTNDTEDDRGFIIAHEQIKLSGSPSIAGAVVAEDGANDANLIRRDRSQGSGHFTLQYDGGLYTDDFALKYVTAPTTTTITVSDTLYFKRLR